MSANLTIPTSEADTTPAFDPATFWQTFHHATATINGTRLHYVEGGAGPPLLLLPGWPQSWYAWRLAMPLFAAAGRRVITLDPRGTGDSGHPRSGYDMKTVAAEIHAFVETLGLTAAGPLDIVGHDLGLWMSYAHAADHPAAVRRIALFDAALPGINPPPTGIPSEEANVKTWHFAFNRLDDLPEILLRGRERDFLTWLFRAKSVRPWTIGHADLNEYARVVAAPGAIRAASAYYRAAFGEEGLAQNRARAATRLQLPILAFGAERGVGPALIDSLRGVADNVQGGVFLNCGHYIPEEAPRAVVREVLRFFAETEG